MVRASIQTRIQLQHNTSKRKPRIHAHKGGSTMDNNHLIRQAIRYQKVATENAFTLYSVLQKSSCEILQQTLNQCSWLPESSTKSVLRFNDECNTISTQLKTLMTDGYEQAETCLVIDEKRVAPVQKKQTPVSTQKNPPEVKTSGVKAAATKTPSADTSDVKGAPVTTTTAKRTGTRKSPAVAKKTAAQARKSPTPRKAAAKKQPAIPTQPADAAPKQGQAAAATEKVSTHQATDTATSADTAAAKPVS